YRDRIGKCAAIPDINGNFPCHVTGKKAVAQLCFESTASLSLDRPILGHFVPAHLRHRLLHYAIADLIAREPTFVPDKRVAASSTLVSGAICFMHRWSFGHSLSLSYPQGEHGTSAMTARTSSPRGPHSCGWWLPE